MILESYAISLLDSCVQPLSYLLLGYSGISRVGVLKLGTKH